MIDFWRNWHITFEFFKNYLYIPLGGNRKRKLNKYKNLFVVMVVGGCGMVLIGTLFYGEGCMVFI